MPYHTMATTPSLALDHCLVHQSGTAGWQDYFSLWSAARAEAPAETAAERKLRISKRLDEADEDSSPESAAYAGAGSYLTAMRFMRSFGFLVPVDISGYPDSYDADALKAVTFDQIFAAVTQSDSDSDSDSGSYPYTITKNVLYLNESMKPKRMERAHPSLRISNDNKRILKVIAPIFTNRFRDNAITETVVRDCLRLSTMLGDEGLGPPVLGWTHFPIALKRVNEGGDTEVVRTHVGLLLMADVLHVENPDRYAEEGKNVPVEAEPHEVISYSSLDRKLYQQAIAKLNADMHETIATHNHFVASTAVASAAAYLPKLIPGLPTNDLIVQKSEAGTFEDPHEDFKVWHVGVEPESLAGWWA